MEQKQQSFSTIGYIAAALGMCIGTGNVWRFPRICAANGGGAFILAELRKSTSQLSTLK